MSSIIAVIRGTIINIIFMLRFIVKRKVENSQK